jgi:hypothetical protein
MRVQITSTVVFSWKLAAFAPSDLRWRRIEYSIAEKTTVPITTQIQKISMCNPYTRPLISVTPTGRFSP